jgi:2-dehydro-3-deoxygluconokinase
MTTSNRAPCVAAFGEILLRLKAPGHERLLQSARLEAIIAGAEANVVSALAGDGIATRMISILPHGALGDVAIGELRRHGVDTSRIIRRDGRLGIYYLEAGAGQRPSRVLYDRAQSAFSTAPPDLIDWRAALDGATWLHLSGITPALNDGTAAMTVDAARAANALGITVSCDYNHRASLWSEVRPPVPIMRTLMPFVQIGIAGTSDCQVMLGIDEPAPVPGDDDARVSRAVAERTLAAFPSLQMQVITRRDGDSAGRYGWSACAMDRSGFHVSRRYGIDDVVDRVGSGDAFSAGLVYGLITGRSNDDALEFATAASCLKHTIPGDVNRVSAAEVDALLAGKGGGRIAR